MAMKKGGFKSPKGMGKTRLRAPGAGKSKPMVGGTDMPVPTSTMMKKGGMVSKGKKC